MDEDMSHRCPSISSLVSCSLQIVEIVAPLIHLRPSILPYWYVQIVEIVGGILHTVVLTLPLPLFVFLPVLEKSERLLDLQQAMGMRIGG